MTTIAELTVGTAELKTSGSPYPGATSDGSTARAFLSFSKGDVAYWSFYVPQNCGSSLSVDIFFMMETATSGNILLDVAVEAITTGDSTDLDNTSSFATTNALSATAVPGTAGYAKRVTIPLSNNDSFAEADMVRLALTRTNSAGDTASGELRFLIGAVNAV